jgi:hypothetical protein
LSNEPHQEIGDSRNAHSARTMDHERPAYEAEFDPRSVDAAIQPRLFGNQHRRISNQPGVALDRLDHIVHRAVSYLFGEADDEALNGRKRHV